MLGWYGSQSETYLGSDLLILLCWILSADSCLCAHQFLHVSFGILLFLFGVNLIKYNVCLSRCTLVHWFQWSWQLFGPMLVIEGGGLQAKEHHTNREARGWQHHVVGVLSCWRDWFTSQNRWHHEVGKLCGHIEAIKTSVRKLKLGRKWTMTPSILPKLWKNGLSTTKSSQSPDLNPIEDLWAELKKHAWARRPTNLTQ